MAASAPPTNTRKRTIADLRNEHHMRLMRWRYGYSWSLFFGGCAVIAFATQSDWLPRIIVFLWMTVPITFWVRHRVRAGP